MHSAASVADQPARQNQKRSGKPCGVHAEQAAHLSDPGGAVGDASSPPAPHIAVRQLETLCKPVLIFMLEDEGSSTFVNWDFAIPERSQDYPISRSGTKSQAPSTE